MRTIRSRIFLSLIIVMIFSVGITFFLFVRFIHGMLLDQSKAQLHIQMEKAISILDGGQLTDLEGSNLQLRFKNKLSEIDYFILNSDNRVVASSNADIIGAIPRLSLARRNGTMRLGSEEVMYSQEKLVGQGELRIVLYTPLSSLQTIFGGLMRLTVISISASFLFILLVGLLMLWKTTRPLEKLKLAVSQYEPYRKPGKLPKADQTEIGQLIGTFEAMAQRIDKHREQQTEFLQHVSHELRTPLMSIQGYAMAIKDQVVTVDLGLDVISKESKRLVRMVERLLQMSRLENVEESWTESVVHIKSMSEQAAQLLTPAAFEKQVIITVEGDELEALLPAEHFFQVIVNLLQNAVRHASSSVALTIGAADLAASRGWVVHVDDDGEGLSEEQFQAVFQRFYKGEKGETGLGLAICRQIADRLGAILKCGKSPLGGARFSFYGRPPELE